MQTSFGFAFASTSRCRKPPPRTTAFSSTACSALSGTSPYTGRWKMRSTCSGSSMPLNILRRTSTKPVPAIRPRIVAADRISTFFGLVGSPGRSAASTMCTLPPVPGALHRQFLHAVQQQHIDVFRHFRVALQLHGAHFGGRQIAKARCVFRLLGLQFGHLLARGLQDRMAVGVGLLQRCDLQTQRGNLLLVLHAAVEVDLRFVGRVDRAGLALIRSERRFRVFEVAFQARALRSSGSRASCSRRPVSTGCDRANTTRRRIRDRGGAVGVAVFERDLDHAGLLGPAPSP